MSALRLALGIRNSHNPIRILSYEAWRWYARLKSDAAFSQRDEQIAARFKRTGIAVLGVSNVEELARIVEEKLADVPIKDGFAQYPRRYNSLLVPHIFKLLQEHRGPIEAYYRSHFKVNWFEVQRIAPGYQRPGSSFGYHTDDAPDPVTKLFIYLTDTYESNGAFRAFEYEYSDPLLRRGMMAARSPGAPRERAQKLVSPDLEKRLTVVEGAKGTVFLFDNNLVHKGTLPRQGIRTHVSMELMPATTPITEAALLDKCDEAIAEYFPANPFRRSGGPRQVRTPFRRRLRQYLNRHGIDVVRCDPSAARAAREDVGPKPAVPRRIVIGGGDYVYGPSWHNVEYVTAGYADKYKALPKHIDIAHDLTAGKPLPIGDQTIEAAYTSHVIEHLKDKHVQFMFHDAWRVLRDGGYFRISCPNIDLYVRAFRDRDLEFFHYRHHPHYARAGINDSVAGLFLDVFATDLASRPTPYTYEDIRASMDSLGVEKALEYYCSQVAYDYAKSHYHVNWFNVAKLTRMLTAAGFSEIYVSALGQSYCPAMRDTTMFDLGDPKISLFVECKK
jgi:predicted SAM-dependent methyltransferase